MFIVLLVVQFIEVARYPAFLNPGQLHGVGKYLVPCLLGIKAERVMFP